ncbi:MAG: hypothetical protein EHM40_02890 [Chloroflexi bacterium]|nr:MAG: hypothetical protein EHM40_02890 [Chloroflexota bacterium]
MDNPILISIIAAIASVVGGAIVFFGNRATNQAKARKDKADASAVEIETFQELVDKVRELSDEVINLKREQSMFISKNTALWQYVYALLEYIVQIGKQPPLPPLELETDPKLMKIIQDISRKAVG